MQDQHHPFFLQGHRGSAWTHCSSWALIQPQPPLVLALGERFAPGCASVAACVRLLGTAVARAQGNLLVLRATTQGTREPGRAVGAEISCFVALRGRLRARVVLGVGASPSPHSPCCTLTVVEGEGGRVPGRRCPRAGDSSCRVGGRPQDPPASPFSLLYKADFFGAVLTRASGACNRCLPLLFTRWLFCFVLFLK